MAKRELSEFEKAFAAARKEQGAGGTFEFKGKKYSTDTAEDKAKSRRKQYEADAVERLRGMTPRMKARDIEVDEPKMPSVRRPTFAESRERPTNIRLFGKTNPEDIRAKMPTGEPGLPPLPRKGLKSGGSVKKYASGGSVGSASKRADGLAKKGKTKGRFV